MARAALIPVYAESGNIAGLLIFEDDGFVFVACDGGTDLGRGLAELGLLGGEEAFLGAGGALGAVEGLKATAETGVAECAVAAAVAGELVDDVADFSSLLVDVDLPGVAEVFAGELGAGEDGRKFRDLEWGGGMVGRDVVCGVGPLSVADGSGGGEQNGGEPAESRADLHGFLLCSIVDKLWGKG